MSIATEITRLQNDSAAIAAAIAAKGVTVPSGSGYDDYATLIASIPSGGGAGDPELPAGYTRKSYIYGGGSSRLQTALSGAMTWHIIAQADPGQTQRYFVGHGTSTGQYMGITSQGTIGLSTTSGANAGSDVAADDKVYITMCFLTNMCNGSINGKSIYRSGSVTRTGDYILFTRASGDSNTIKAKIWQADAWNANGVAFHGIPCLDPNGVAGMYDTVSQTFYPSSTSTPFTAG